MRINRQGCLNLTKLFPIGGDGLIRELARVTLPKALTESSGHRIQAFVDNRGRMLQIDTPDLRKLSADRSTWVSPCWVALQAAA